MKDEKMKVCKKCVLPESVPSSRIDKSGLCAYCRQFKSEEIWWEERQDYKRRFEAILQELVPARGPYDVLVAYSGGKDSTFTLAVLKKVYGLRVLAMTFDHGFVSTYAIENIKRVVEALGIDHLSLKPNFQLMQKVFRYSIEKSFHPSKALERASSICNTCMGLVKFALLRTAIEKGIPLVGYGWSPGQAPLKSSLVQNTGALLRKTQELFLRPLEAIGGSAIRAFFLDEWHLEKNRIPYNVNPLAFLPYSEAEIYNNIIKLGWIPPKDTDPNSTNCLLNAFANDLHLAQFGYHPYAMELSELVREGIMKREEALQRLSQPSQPEVIAFVKAKLGLWPQEVG
ncbi:MAG: 7-cyano-7-deazaguanine synthase [candidate division WOR-3 bacterium]